MRNKDIRVSVIILAIIVVLALLLVGQFIYKEYNVEQPLFKVYSKTKAVQNVDISEKDGRVKIVLRLGPTANLQLAYGEIMAATTWILGPKPFELKIKDNRSPVLEDLLVETEPVIYEAMSKGSYTWMKKEIISAARTNGAEAQVFMDSERIYLAFTKGRNYLYEIIPRNRAEVLPDGSKGSDNSA